MKTVFRSQEPVTYDLSKLNVLLVEDSHTMQTLLSSMLRSFGVGDVLVCGGATEAIGLLTVTQARKKASDIKGIDIILTDWLMPDGSGEDLLKWIRLNKDDGIRFLPVVVISAYTTERVVAAARDGGANEALVKPVSGMKLAQRLLSAIDNPRPFIKTDAFFGPDRRRQAVPVSHDRRKIKAEEIKVSHEQL
ncbi:MAG: response regulator [Rhodospirillales bacterium]|nr:response regulator [Rhodospirillales bacterium]